MDAIIEDKFLSILQANNILIHSEDYERLAVRFDSGSAEFVEALIRENLVAHHKACKLWADSLAVAYVDPLSSLVMPEALEKIPHDIASKTGALPLYRIDTHLTVALSDPFNESTMRRLEGISGLKVSPVFALPCEIRDAIEVHYSSEVSIQESIEALEKTEGLLVSELSPSDLANMGESRSIIKIFDSLLYLAIKERTSDIHIEPEEESTRIRLRIDGRLREVLRFSKSILKALTVRAKILCGVNVSDTRFPQDGRFTISLGTNKVSFRVSFIPTIDGEKIVIRILAPSGKKDFLTLDQMLISQSVLNPFKRLIKSPNGIIFVTGPTGSGKTTTLYAALQEINGSNVNISTIEDPVEMRLEGLVQSQVNNHIDLSFARLLRSLLRQDPDIILVGEIRDLETAKIATEAALTGHLVFSTLHSNNAIQSIVRLVEIGIPAYMVAPSILGVLAQRLAARICDKCKESYVPSVGLLERFFHDAEDCEVSLYRGRGCNDCRGTGYRGRIAFHELVLVTEEIRSLISDNAGLKDLTAAARNVGYKPLRYDGLKKALLGLTTIEEVEKLAGFEWAT